jgi:hypothetical protein
MGKALALRRINTAGRAGYLALRRGFHGEITMPFRQGAILLTLLCTVALTIAHQIGSGPDRLASLAGRMPGPGEATGSIDPATQIGIELSDEQRGFLFLGVMNLADVPDVEWPESTSLIGLPTVLPDSVELQDLPAMVTRKIPLVRHHKFVKLDDRILVVRPADRVVVAEIPRYRLLP